MVQDELRRGTLRVKKAPKFREQKTKFDNYEKFGEPVARVASHRYLAICRGEAEGVLKPSFELDEARVASALERTLGLSGNDPWTKLLARAVDDALTRLLIPSARSSVRAELGDAAERDAIKVFAKNLEQLLLTAPFGARWVLGIDPGQRTGCKLSLITLSEPTRPYYLPYADV